MTLPLKKFLIILMLFAFELSASGQITSFLEEDLNVECSTSVLSIKIERRDMAAFAVYAGENGIKSVIDKNKLTLVVDLYRILLENDIISDSNAPYSLKSLNSVMIKLGANRLELFGSGLINYCEPDYEEDLNLIKHGLYIVANQGDLAFKNIATRAVNYPRPNDNLSEFIDNMQTLFTRTKM